jgi:hypothetical protein
MRLTATTILLLLPTAGIAADPPKALFEAGMDALQDGYTCERLYGAQTVKAARAAVEAAWSAGMARNEATLSMDRAAGLAAAYVDRQPRPAPDADERKACEDLAAESRERVRVEAARYRQNAKKPPTP